MKKDITDQLRRFASVPGKQRTSVSELTDDQLYELFLRLRNAEGAASIARHAQKVWKVNPHSSTHSISQGILKFRQRIAHLLLTGSIPNADGISNLDFTLSPEEGSTLEIMEALAKDYQARVKAMIDEEKETGVKYPFINRDLQALANLRKAILKQKEWELTHEDPLKRKEYEKMGKRIERRFNGLMEYLGEDGQDRMIRAADRFLELAEQHVLTMYRKEDGTYTLVDPEKKPKGGEKDGDN
jgi:hypothetical protein